MSLEKKFHDKNTFNKNVLKKRAYTRMHLHAGDGGAYIYIYFYE